MSDRYTVGFTHGDAFVIKDGDILADVNDVCRKLNDYERTMKCLADLLVVCEEARVFLDEIEWREGGGSWYDSLVGKMNKAVADAKRDRQLFD